jgi:hypothetical protein
VPTAPLHHDAARLVVGNAALHVDNCARQAIAAMIEGDDLRTTLVALRRLSRPLPVNTVALRRRLAAEAVARGGYPL